MNKITLSKIFALIIVTFSTGIYAKPDLYLINNSMWDVKIKFAEPNNLRAIESTLRSGQTKRLGDNNEANNIAHISVRRSGLGSSLISDWQAIDTNDLIKTTNTILSSLKFRNKKVDIYWNIESTATGWRINPIVMEAQ